MPRWIRMLSQWQALAAALIGLAAALVTLTATVWSVHAKASSARVPGSAATVSTTTAPNPVVTTITASPPGTSFADTPASPTTTDAERGAQVGDCFDNDGTSQVARLVATACRPEAFMVVQILQDTTDASGCAGVADDSWNVSDAADDLVLCLSYQPYGTAYYAGPGACVYGAGPTETWYEEACSGGRFTVLARYVGTADASQCASPQGYDLAESLTVPNRSDLDVLLCLSFDYPQGAIGHAPVGTCLYPSGPGNELYFTAAGCASGNVQVTWRDGVYDDVGTCESYGLGWATWHWAAFPTLSYTVCYRRL